jgi:choline-sulfatase
MPFRTWLVLAGALAVALAADAASRATQAQAQAAPASEARRTAAPNLLLVTVDTLRADRVGAYGYAPAATPAFDRLAREGVLLEDAVVSVPQTRPSHATLFSGRYPYEHGLRDNAHGPLDPKWPTLATLLRKVGYDTAAFIGAYPVSRSSGLHLGFRVFDDPFGGVRARGRREPRSERRAEEVADAALGWLAGRSAGIPFFLWVHLFDPHAPYEAPEPFGSRFARSPYDGEVAYADAQLARLLERLEGAGLARDTLVVATSDHGEGLGEHGEDEHMLLVYDTTLRVPLVLRWPGRLPAGARVAGQFRAVDLLPTLLELLGQPAVATSGASRASSLRSGSGLPETAAYAESLYGQLHFGWAPVRALRGEGWKYIEAPRAELYEVRTDPGETRNRIDERPQVASGMSAALARHGRGEMAAAAPPDAEVAERLAALGYVGGGGFQGSPSGADPKDRVAAFSAYQRDTREAVRLYSAGDTARALTLLRRLAGSPIPSFNVSYYLGRALVDSRLFAEAIAPLEQAVVQVSGIGPAWAYLAEAYRGAGRGAEAAQAVERGLRSVPGHPGLRLARGRLALGRGDLAGARVDLEAARQSDPDDADVRTALSDLYRAQGDVARALEEAEAALRLDPEAPARHVARGLALGAAGREAEAGAAFREALRRDAAQPDALYYLAAVERRAGRPRAALPLLEQLARVAPDYPGAEPALAATRAELAPLAEGMVRLQLMRLLDRAAAQAAQRRLAAGEEFAAVAAALSRDARGAAGGDLGAVRVADLAEPLRSAAAALAPGAVSAPVAVGDGYVILKRER